MEISDLQNKLKKTQETLKWLMYESTIIVNAATPFVMRYMKPENTENWTEQFADPTKLDEYGSTALLCFRDATAANIYAAVELFADNASAPGTEYELQRDNLSELSKKMNKLFREKHTNTITGELIGEAYKRFHNNTILGEPGDLVEKSIAIRKKDPSRLTRITKMFSKNKENS